MLVQVFSDVPDSALKWSRHCILGDRLQAHFACINCSRFLCKHAARSSLVVHAGISPYASWTAVSAQVGSGAGVHFSVLQTQFYACSFCACIFHAIILFMLHAAYCMIVSLSMCYARLYFSALIFMRASDLLLCICRSAYACSASSYCCTNACMQVMCVQHTCTCIFKQDEAVSCMLTTASFLSGLSASFSVPTAYFPSCHFQIQRHHHRSIFRPRSFRSVFRLLRKCRL